MLRMPFGKHKHKPLDEIPVSYLLWLMANVDMNPTLRYAVEEEIRSRREGARQYTRPPSQQQASQAVGTLNWESVLQRWHHQMVRRWHPDCGGSNEIMAAINSAVDNLRDMFRAEAG